MIGRLIEFIFERWDRIALAGFTFGLALIGLSKLVSL
jgi:hypothetical protein